MRTHSEHINSRLRLLFVDHGATLNHKLHAFHSHSYWQLEIVVFGDGALELGERASLSLAAGDLVFVPAWVRHRFNYFGDAKESWSFKFDVESESPGRPAVIRDDPEGDVARDALIRLASCGVDLLESSVFAGLIDALRQTCFPPRQQIVVSPAAELIARVRASIRRNERLQIDVACLAEELGYSRNYFSTYFRTQTGLSPKQVIDQERIEIAQRHLCYSSRSIGEIAERMGFPDAFTFSHFFKRVTGSSPSAFRAANPPARWRACRPREASSPVRGY